MTPRLARLCLAVSLAVLVSHSSAQNAPPAPGAAQNPPPLPTNPPIAPAAPEEELVQLQLPDADIDTVLSALEIYTGRIILSPQQLTTATYNLKIKKQHTKSV